MAMPSPLTIVSVTEAIGEALQNNFDSAVPAGEPPYAEVILWGPVPSALWSLYIAGAM